MGIEAVEAATAVSEVVDEHMASAGRMHAVESGKDLGVRLMIAFGGNGPLHATRVARRAGVRRILIPRDPGVGSAVGFLFAPVSFELIRSYYTLLQDLDFDALNALLAEMREEAECVVRAGAPSGPLTRRRVAFMRYHGQGHEIEIELPDDLLSEASLGALQDAFEVEYSRQFSRVVPDMQIEVLNWGVSVASAAPDLQRDPVGTRTRKMQRPEGHRRIWCNVTNAWTQAAVFERAKLEPGVRFAGPALVIEPQTTTYVSRDFSASVDSRGNLWMIRQEEEAAT